MCCQRNGKIWRSPIDVHGYLGFVYPKNLPCWSCASARVDLSMGGGGTPCHVGTVVPPVQVPGQDKGEGVPFSGQEVPPSLTWEGGTTPRWQMGLPRGCELTHKLKILPSPIPRIRAVIKFGVQGNCWATLQRIVTTYFNIPIKDVGRTKIVSCKPHIYSLSEGECVHWFRSECQWLGDKRNFTIQIPFCGQLTIWNLLTTLLLVIPCLKSYLSSR